MKKIIVLASVLSAVCLFSGCAENEKFADAHICTHFYENVNNAGKQTPIVLESNAASKLPDEHVLYALTLNGYITEKGVSFMGDVTIPVTKEGTLIVTTSNLEKDFVLTYNGFTMDPLPNNECDVNSYQFYAETPREYNISVGSSNAQVMLTYEIQ